MGQMPYHQVHPEEHSIAIVCRPNVIHLCGGTLPDLSSDDHTRQHEDEGVCQKLQLLPARMLSSSSPKSCTCRQSNQSQAKSGKTLTK